MPFIIGAIVTAVWLMAGGLAAYLFINTLNAFFGTTVVVGFGQAIVLFFLSRALIGLLFASPPKESD